MQSDKDKPDSCQPYETLAQPRPNLLPAPRDAHEQNMASVNLFSSVSVISSASTNTPPIVYIVGETLIR